MSEKQVKITSDLSLQNNKIKDAKINAQDNEISNLDTTNLAPGILRQIASENPSEDKLLSEYGVQHSIDVAVSGFNSMIQQGLADEKLERTNVDAAIRAELAQEVTARESADNTIIASVETETNARIAENNRLANLISNNVNSIRAEESLRTAADNQLQEQIDGLSTAASGIFDFVNTYTDLENYDTSKLKIGDVIKVLTDSTHQDMTSYYRWNGSSFEYKGSEAPTYTKAQADATFVPQTRTINGKALSSNITLNASDVNALPDSTDLTDLVTPAQAAALNSGIDSSKVEQIAINSTNIGSLNTRVESAENSVINLGNRVGSVESSVSTLNLTKQPLLSSNNEGSNIDIWTDSTGVVKISASVEGYEVDWAHIVGNPYDNEHFNEVMHTKQDVLIAGDGISIENNVITNTRVSAEWGNVTGDIHEQNDLMDEFNTKQDVLIAGNGIIIDNNTISVNPEIFPKSEYNKYTLTLLAGTTSVSTGIDLSMKASNVFLNGIYQTINRDYTLTTIAGNTHIVFTNTYTENAIIDLEVFDLNLYQGSTSPEQPITVLPNNQSSYSFNTNTVNQFTLNANVSAVTFNLPVPQNTGISNSILIHTYIGNASITVNWGTSKFFNDEAPSIDTYGYYDILYVYNNLLNTWVCKVTFIVEEQRIDYKNYIVDVNLNYNNSPIIPQVNELIANIGDDTTTSGTTYTPTINGNIATFNFNNITENIYNWAYIQYLGNESYEPEQANIMLEQTNNVTFDLSEKIEYVNQLINIYTIDINNSMVLMGDPIYVELYKDNILISNDALYGDSGGEYQTNYELIRGEQYQLDINFYGNETYKSTSDTIVLIADNEPIYYNLVLEDAVSNYIIDAEDYGYSVYQDEQTYQEIISFGAIKEQTPGIIFTANDNQNNTSVLTVSKYNTETNQIIVEVPADYTLNIIPTGTYTNSAVDVSNNMIYNITTPFVDPNYQYNLVTKNDLPNYNIEINSNGIIDLPNNNGNTVMLPDNTVLENVVIYINDTNTATYEINGVVDTCEYNLVGPNTKVQMVYPIVTTGVTENNQITYNNNVIMFGDYSKTSLCNPIFDAASGICLGENVRLTTKNSTFYQQGSDATNIIIDNNSSWKSYQDTFQYTRFNIGNSVVFSLVDATFVEQNSLYDYLLKTDSITNNTIISLYNTSVYTIDDEKTTQITIENYNNILRSESYLQGVIIFINGEMI